MSKSDPYPSTALLIKFLFNNDFLTLLIGNKVCRQIPWDDDPEKLKAWKEARTGYPHIDAIMTQLKREGWIHHLARHSVACFLTRGDLWQSWEAGQHVFEVGLLNIQNSIYFQLNIILY